MLKPYIELSDLLSPDEREEFSSLIHVVRMGVSGLVESGRALTVIRDKRLYREKFSTFEKFCEDEFRMSKSYAYRLISGFKNIEALSNEVKPSNESVVRELKKVPTMSKQGVWNRALKMSKKPTAVVVREAAEIELVPETGRAEREMLDQMRCAKRILEKVDVSKMSPASIPESIELIGSMVLSLRNLMGGIMSFGFFIN